MPKNDNFQETFKQLKTIFKPYAAKLRVVQDTDTNYYLDTPATRLFVKWSWSRWSPPNTSFAWYQSGSAAISTRKK